MGVCIIWVRFPLFPRRYIIYTADPFVRQKAEDNLSPGKKLGQRRVFSDFNLLLFYVWFYYEPPLSLSLLQFPGIAETCRRPIDRIENCKARDAIVPQGYQSGRSFFFVFIAYCEQIIIDGTITVVTSGSRSESRALLLSSIIVRA